jgi:RecJ-like exonuclease
VVNYERDDHRCRIHVSLAGVVSVDDLLGIVDRQAAESTWQYSLCYDARRVVKDGKGSVDDVRRVLRHTVETTARHGERGPVAIVTDNPADYTIVRMYAALAEPHRITIEVFRDPESAVRWLDSVDAAKAPRPRV